MKPLPLHRRSFLRKAAAAGLLAAAAPRLQGQDSKPGGYKSLKKACVWGMLPGNLSWQDRFQLARNVGFDGVEVGTLDDAAEVEKVHAAAEKAGIRVHSIMNQAHWGQPLSSPDADVVRKSLDGLRTSLRNAKALGADTVLLVPGVVNEKIRYADAYERSQKHIREVLPLARELGVTIAVENVWNKFLLSPLEFAKYVDEFNDSALRSYFDVGNVVLTGFPQDWIRTLGKRIVKVHMKGYDARKDATWGAFCNLRDGSIQWPEVRKAFDEVGYDGWMTAELKGGDEAYLRSVVADLDKIIRGE
jgi:L-ribulose-5-phosphate 3-epimerase